MSQEPVLIVDDDREIRNLIAFNLTEAGMNVSHASTGNEALQQLGAATFYLVILDIMMKDMDGFDVLRQMRAQSLNTPVILVSARQEDIDKIHGLGIGADDYITKPFSPQELVARAKAHIRRFTQKGFIGGPSELGILEYGIFRLEPASRIVYKREQPIQLTETESLLLQALMKSPRRPLTKVGVYKEVWGEQNYNENLLNVGISRLRNKIEDDPKNPRCIQTVWGLGYRFTKDE